MVAPHSRVFWLDFQFVNLEKFNEKFGARLMTEKYGVSGVSISTDG